MNADNIEGGMSGSPIIADDGSAIGLISVSGDDRRKYVYCTGPQPTERLQSNDWQDVLERVVAFSL